MSNRSTIPPSTRVLRERKVVVKDEPPGWSSPTQMLRKRKLAIEDGPSSTSSTPPSSSSPPVPPPRKRHVGPQYFTLSQETFIAEQMADPDMYAVRQGTNYEGERGRLKSEFYRSLPTVFAMTFGITFDTVKFWKKIYYMKKLWRSTHQMRHSGRNRGIPQSVVDMQVRKRCHYYFILEPIWGQNRTILRTDSVGGSKPTAHKVVSGQDHDDVDDEDDEDVDDDGDIEYEEYSESCDEEHGVKMDDGDAMKTQSSINTPGVFTIMTKDSHAKQCQGDKSRNNDDDKARTTQAQIKDLLAMLKDIKDSSIVQYEAEKEQTRREQLRLQERTVTQEEITKREQLRIEETRMREEETTKREAIRAEVEKMKEQVRMKELELEHTNRLLLLEETRLKRAILEKESFAQKVEEGAEAAK